MKIKNEFILDGKVQRDVKYFDDHIAFNISSITGKCLTEEGKERPKYTFIRVLYFGELNDDVIKTITEGNLIRLYGRIDSEQYKDKKGKTVYNKILYAEHISKLLKADVEILEEKVI